MTSNGSNTDVPFSSGIFFGGNQRSHCAASPAAQNSLSAGSTERCSGRNRLMLSRNQVTDPDHSTRSAITVAGIDGCSASNALTLASNGVNDVDCDGRSYFGGRSDLTADATVSRAMPRSRAT
jgi:hypothetical protein